MGRDILYQLALTMLPDIGAITAKKLIAYTGSAEAVFQEKTASLARIPGIGKKIISRIRNPSILSEAEKELAFAERRQVKVLSYLSEEYPERLRNCEDGPVILFVKGENCLAAEKVLSVVGTRSATAEGRELCRDIVEGLARICPGLLIVSGLAYGIDIVAHRSALVSSLRTIAVLAHGLQTIYPYLHRETAGQITGQGALVTDFTTGIQPERNNFLRRNRIIAGLADATLVVESGEKGGALITAELAASYNRDVFAVPGRVSDHASKGCNMLIKRNMAALVETASDLAAFMSWDTAPTQYEAETLTEIQLNTEEEMILRSLETDPDAGTELLSLRTGLAIQHCISTLVAMELRGWVLPLPGNRYRLRVKLPKNTKHVEGHR